MPFGVPRTDEERAKRHAEIYGAESVQPPVRQGLGPVMETIPEVIWAWLPAFPPDLPVPRWAAIKVRGAGLRLK